MKTDIDIKDDIYNYLKGTALVENVTGKLSKTKRPSESKAEDIVISVLANTNGQIQEAYVNINIYIADLKRNQQYEEDSIRLRELCKLASNTLDVVLGDDYRISLEEQRVIEVAQTNEHVINNKILYKTINY